MRVCDKCKKPISVANTRKVQIVNTDGHSASAKEEYSLKNIEICPDCASELISEILEKYSYKRLYKEYGEGMND